MTKYFFQLILVLAAVPFAELCAQTGPAFEYQMNCAEPAFSGFATEPKLTGTITVDGVDATIGDFVGVLDANGDLLGQGQVGMVTVGGPPIIGVIIQLQTNDQGMGCAVFANGDEITVLLSADGDTLTASNSVFTATAGANGRLDGPDGSVNDTDNFDFLPNALPVSLTSFTATPNSNAVKLTWSTSDETDNDYFEVQRSANPIEGFVNIGKVLGNETTSNQSDYVFTDNAPGTGANYYRLQQFDHDGYSDFSPIVVADMEVSSELAVSVFPNPTTAGGRMTMRLNGGWANANVKMVDANGREIANWTGLSNGSLNTVLPVVKAGVYQLIATDGKEQRITRLVVR